MQRADLKDAPVEYLTALAKALGLCYPSNLLLEYYASTLASNRVLA